MQVNPHNPQEQALPSNILQRHPTVRALLHLQQDQQQRKVENQQSSARGQASGLPGLMGTQWVFDWSASFYIISQIDLNELPEHPRLLLRRAHRPDQRGWRTTTQQVLRGQQAHDPRTSALSPQGGKERRGPSHQYRTDGHRWGQADRPEHLLLL
jgi:hypothetical protein